MTVDGDLGEEERRAREDAERQAKEDAERESREAEERKRKAKPAPAAKPITDLPAFYADLVNSDRYLPVSAISNTMRDAMLARGLVTAARTPVKELEAHLGLKLLTPEEAEDIDTLGGLVFSIVGRVPARGELIRHSSGTEFEVLDADPRRIKKLRVHPPKSQPAAPVPAPPKAD